MNSFKSESPFCICSSSRRAAVLLSATLGMLLMCLPLFSQGSYGRILGAVTDQTGGVIAGATVTVLDVDRGISRTLTTDDAGEYNAPNLQPGKYIVRAEAKGFKTVERQNIILEVGKEPRVDLSLQPGEQTQTVTVTESIPLVETTNATLGGTLNNAQISDLPLNGRNYQNLMGLRPGVMIQPGGGPWTQSTNGVRPDESGWMVEGVLNVNFFDARPVAGMPSPFQDAATILPVDAIQEFNLMESPKAEYGLKAGAIVNVGIKSGTNTLHGAAYAFGRTDAWDARNYFNPAPIGGVCAGNPNTPVIACNKLATQLKQFGGVVGGPIKKDKLFFFAGYEGLRDLIGSALTTNVPGTGSSAGTGGVNPANNMVDAINAVNATGLPLSAVSENLICPNAVGQTLPLPTSFVCTGGLYQISSTVAGTQLSPFANENRSDNGIGKLDYHLNDKNTITGMYFLGKYTGIGEDHPFTNQLFVDSAPLKALTTVERWVYTPNSVLVNEMHFGYNRVTFNFVNTDASHVYPLNSGVTTPGGLPNIYIAPFNGGYLGTNPNRPQLSSPNPYFDFSDSISLLKGKHAFKFGGEFLHIEADDTIYVAGRGLVHFNGGQNTVLGAPSTGLEDFFIGSPSIATLLAGSPDRKVHWTSTSGFFQDDWRVTQKVIVNLGLRYEYTSPMKAANNLFGSFDPNLGMVQQGQQGYGTIWKPDYRNFSPRVGFAWDVNGKGTTVVRGGASVMYSSFVLNTMLAEFSLQNDLATSIAAVPTGALIQTSGCVALGATSCSPVVNGGGTIPLTTTTFGSTTLTSNWKNNSSTVPLFPPPVAKCGDGIGTDASPCDLMGIDPNLRSPYLVNYNLGVTHTFGANLSLEIGYVGNLGRRLLGFKDINQPALGAAQCLNTPTAAQAADACVAGSADAGLAAQEARPFYAKFPYLGFINWGSNQDYSNYNSLQVTLTKRMSQGLSFTAGYTYGHGLDTGSLNRFSLLPQDSNKPQLEYASSDFDIRHRFTITGTYNIPGIKGFGQLLEGWQINAIANIQSPQPWNVSDSTNNNSGTNEFSDRWNINGNAADFRSGSQGIPYCSGFGSAAGPSCVQATLYGNLPAASAASAAASQCAVVAASTASLDTGGCYVSTNGKSFLTPAAPGTFGNMGRNIFRDSGLKTVDFSVFKNFTFRERYGIQFRVEVFNLLNHPIFANPYGASNGFLGPGYDPSTGSLGYASSTPDGAAGNPLVGSGANRDMQLGLKLTF